MSTYSITLKDAYDGLSKQLLGMKKSSQQAVAHRKKFQLVISQFSQFLEAFQENVTDEELESEQIEAYQNILSISHEYFQLFRLHYLHCWAHSAIDDPCTRIATEICSLTARLHDEADILYPEGAEFFDSNDPKWLQFHVMDLKAISESFKQYCNSPASNKKIVAMMENKQNSINKFISETETEQLLPGVRVFSPIPINYQIWRVEHSDFIEENEIGSGSFAVVYYGHYKPTGQEIAIKSLKNAKLSSTNLTLFQREVIVLATVKHPTLLTFIGATDTPPYCILTEWMGGGSLFQEINKNHLLSATQLSIAAFDVARGMAYLHAVGIIHRDLKSLNILLDDNGHAKVCDFGLSRFQSTEDKVYTQNIGTPHWMAPEILGGASNYNEKIDVYAYGIVLWEMLCKKVPYTGLEPQQVIGQVLLNNIRPAIPKTAPEGVANLIRMCWDRDPANRPSFQEILKIWKSGEIYFPLADKKEILEYIEKSMDASEKAADDVESYLSSSSSSEIEVFYQTLLKDGIPDELAERCWYNLQSIDHQGHVETYVKCLGMFLKTANVNEAANALRKLPCNSLRDIYITSTVTVPMADAPDNSTTNNSNANVKIIGVNSSNKIHSNYGTRPNINLNNRIVINPQHGSSTNRIVINPNISNKNNNGSNASNSNSPNDTIGNNDKTGDFVIKNKIVNEICEMLPTGNTKLDDDLFMIACKNGAIEEAFLRAISSKQIITALELLSRIDEDYETTSPELLESVYERAVKCLKFKDTSIRISVIRFLVVKNESKRLPHGFIKENIRTRNLTLQNALLVAVSQIASNGILLPKDIIDLCFSRMDETFLAGTVVVNSCSCLTAADYILNSLNSSNMPSIELTLKILIQICKHEKLRPKMKKVMEKLYLPRYNDDIAKAIDKIYEIIDKKHV